MTPDDLKDARRTLGLSQTGLAEALRMGKNGRDTIRAWESDDNVRGVPGPAQVAIECLLKHGTISAQKQRFPTPAQEPSA